MSADAWGRLRTRAETDPVGTCDLVELIVEHELAGSYAHLPFEEVAPVLRAALSCGHAEVRSRAERLIHRLAEKAGRDEYGRLLQRRAEAAEDSGQARDA